MNIPHKHLYESGWFRRLRWASFNHFEIGMTLSEAESASGSGDNTAGVIALLELPKIKEQLAKIPSGNFVKELREYGAWSQAELKDREANEQRVIWLAANEIAETFGVYMIKACVTGRQRKLKERINRNLSDVDDRYGAPMGRRDNITEPDYPVQFKLERLRFIDGDYDEGGAYWGKSTEPVYHAWGDGEEEQQEIFVRAGNREKAKAKVLETFPNASFLR